MFKLYFILKILPCYTAGLEQEPESEPPDPEPHQNFYPGAASKFLPGAGSGAGAA
jgi:hypothetical protein